MSDENTNVPAGDTPVVPVDETATPEVETPEVAPEGTDTPAA